MSTDGSGAKENIFNKASAFCLPQGCRCPMSRDMEYSEICLRLLEEVQIFFQISCYHKGLLIIIHLSVSHCLSHRVTSFYTAQLSLHKTNGHSSHVRTNQTAISAHWLLWFVHVSIQIVSVEGWMAIAIQTDALPQLEPSAYQNSAEFFLFLLYTLQGQTQGWEQ